MGACAHSKGECLGECLVDYRLGAGLSKDMIHVVVFMSLGKLRSYDTFMHALDFFLSGFSKGCWVYRFLISDV